MNTIEKDVLIDGLVKVIAQIRENDEYMKHALRISNC